MSVAGDIMSVAQKAWIIFEIVLMIFAGVGLYINSIVKNNGFDLISLALTLIFIACIKSIIEVVREKENNND